ncbi:MAG: restriction endonuclease subunit S [Kiritimatiellae bacterium]|nr:restriction endonuclease subunit S [Kiritimatiellia bacterium]
MIHPKNATRLDAIASVRSGVVLARKQATGEGGIPYRLLTLRAVHPEGRIEGDKLGVFHAAGRLSEEYVAQAEDIVIRLTEPYTAVLVDETTAGMVVSSNFTLIRVGREPRRVLPGYLFWLLNTRAVKRDIFGHSAGNMLGAIHPRYFAGMEIELPPIAQQRAIAALHSLALRETVLLRRLAEEKRRYCDRAIARAMNENTEGT